MTRRDCLQLAGAGEPHGALDAEFMGAEAGHPGAHRDQATLVSSLALADLEFSPAAATAPARAATNPAAPANPADDGSATSTTTSP